MFSSDWVNFIPTLAVLLAQYFPEQLDPTLKPVDDAQNYLKYDNQLEFDFIIVGAGSAGCVLANRLSENPKWNVLLLEAGGPEDFISDTPGALEQLMNSPHDWNYTTVKQNFACLSTKGICFFPRGHLMGGTSAINAQMYVRGNANDFDEWAEMGNPGWSYKEVLPYFLKTEDVVIPELTYSSYHATKGELTIGYSNYDPGLVDVLIKAAEEYGLQNVDYNGASQIGFGRAQLNIRNATRCSTSKAFLDPIRHRKNLHIFMNTLVTKIIIDEATRTAIGVSCITGGKEYNVYSSKEVILSAGTINSPKLLMLSGIGRKEHLEELDIPLLADLPVGKNLQDHPQVGLIFKMNSCKTCCYQYSEDAILEYARNRSGPLTDAGGHILAFINKKNDTKLPPDIQFTILRHNVSSFEENGAAHFIISVINSKPDSLGEVRLVDKDYKSDPLIDPNLFGAKSDVEKGLWGMSEAIKYISTSTLADYSPQLDLISKAPCIKDIPNLFDKDSLICLMQYCSQSLYHPVGTARMGPRSDSTTVVDPTLKVHTINRLRVVDASIMPRITRGNTNAPTIMIAEKAADIIIKEYSNLINICSG